MKKKTTKENIVKQRTDTMEFGETTTSNYYQKKFKKRGTEGR